MRTLIFLLVISLGFTSLAQDYRFGKISDEELKEKFNSKDSSASATYLYKYRKTYYNYVQNQGFQLITDVHERIKIYNQEGFEYATHAVNLYRDNSTREKISSLKAYTYNLVDNKKVDVKLKKNAVFNTEKYSFLDETKFTMPNIKEGSVIEYEYTIVSPFYTNVNEFKLQHNIPVKKLSATFEAPEYFNFKVNVKGFLPINLQEDSRRSVVRFPAQKEKREGLGVVQQARAASEVDFTTNIDAYLLSNIPALKDEPYVNNIDNYRSSVKYEISYIKFPNSPIDYYSTTWEDVVKAIYKNPSFGEELNKTGYFENDIDNLITSISDPIKKIHLIYDYVKAKVKWNNYYGKYTNDGVRKAYKDRVGNVAEINLMLTSMLRYAGLDANPVLVSTRNNGIPLFPTREGYNYVVSCVQLQEGNILLDATSKYGSPNILPYRALNWDGRIITKDGNSTLISLYPKTQSKNTIALMAKLDEEGTVEGNYRIIKTNHNALSYRGQYNDADKDDFLEKLENKYNGIEISDFTVTNAKNLSKPISETYKFVKESQADIIGDKIYFSPLFFLASSENPFKLEKREFPVDFGYPSESMYSIIINLPQGYKIESIPETASLALPDNLGTFKYNISQNGSTINLLINSEINKSIISPIYYDALKEYFKLLIEKENEKIVLTKS